MATFARTVVDDFDDNSVSGSWDKWGTTVAETGGQLVITSNTGAGNYQGMDRTSSVNFDETWWGVKVVSAGTQQSQLETVPCQADFGGGNAFYWAIRNGQATCWTAIAGNYNQRGTGLSYNPSTHVYFAIGINGSGQLSWMWSTNGTDFTEHATYTNPYSGTTATYVLYAGRESSGGSSTSIVFDDFASWVASSAETMALGGTLPVLTGTVNVTASATFTVGGTLPALTGQILAIEGVQITVGGTLPALTGQILAAAATPGVTVTPPGGVIPVRTRTTTEILTGSRATSVRAELLSRGEVYKGALTGVVGGALDWRSRASVHAGGLILLVDRGQPIDWLNDRIRIYMTIDDLPEQSLGVYVLSEAPEQWSGAGCTREVGLLDKTSILDQDAMTDAYALDAGAVVTDEVASLIASTGETSIAITPSVATLPAPVVWEVGTTKLQIVNDLLARINYFSLYCDERGQYRAEPYTRPADRPLRWEFVDGKNAIYTSRFVRDVDLYGVPNRVIAVSRGWADTPALKSVATNVNPASRYSTVSRGGQVFAHVERDIDVVDQAALDAYAERVLIERTAPTSTIEIRHAFVPGLTFNDAVRFRREPAGIDARHVMSSTTISLDPTDLCVSALQEVVSL